MYTSVISYCLQANSVRKYVIGSIIYSANLRMLLHGTCIQSLGVDRKIFRWM